MTIRCGHCKGTHSTVAEVRSCASPAPALARSARRREPAAEGMYLVNGTPYKVKLALHGSGRPYALALREGEWVLEPGMVNHLRPADRMTLEQAAQYGHLYGQCVRCLAPLTDEASIARGIGPVCAGKL